MTANFYITKFASRVSVKDGVTRVFNSLMLADADPSPITRLSSEVELALTDEELAKMGGDTSKLRGQQVHLVVKGMASSRFGGPPVLTGEFLGFVQQGK